MFRVVSPGQTRSPGLPPTHCRVWISDPFPQVTGQVPESSHDVHPLVHGSVLHISRCSVASPCSSASHVTELKHVLVRTLSPPLQVALHGPKSVHSEKTEMKTGTVKRELPRSQSTATKLIKKKDLNVVWSMRASVLSQSCSSNKITVRKRHKSILRCCSNFLQFIASLVTNLLWPAETENKGPFDSNCHLAITHGGGFTQSLLMLNFKQGSCWCQFLWYLVWPKREWNPLPECILQLDHGSWWTKRT